MSPGGYKEAVEFVADDISKELAKMIPKPEELQFGGIIGKANLVACIEPHHVERIPWQFFSCYGFQLADATPAEFIPCRGMPGFFMVDELVKP